MIERSHQHWLSFSSGQEARTLERDSRRTLESCVSEKAAVGLEEEIKQVGSVRRRLHLVWSLAGAGAGCVER